MIGLVTDVPIWESCPYRDKVPAEIEIRADADSVVFWWPRYELHVGCSRGYASESDCLGPVLGNLTGAVFEKEFPGMFPEMIKIRYGVPIDEIIKMPQNLAAAFARFEELEKFRQVPAL